MIANWPRFVAGALMLFGRSPPSRCRFALPAAAERAEPRVSGRVEPRQHAGKYVAAVASGLTRRNRVGDR